MCRTAKHAGEGAFINHGKAFRLITQITEASEPEPCGFSNAWAIIPSGGFPVWQMR